MAENALHLTNAGPTDVCDGNEKIIMVRAARSDPAVCVCVCVCVRGRRVAAHAAWQGLLWTIISKFQVADIVIEGVSGKDGLLLWCKRQTTGYPGVEIEDFTRSWENGMAFLAILHKHRPETIDMGSIDPANKAANMALAFRVAEEVRAVAAQGMSLTTHSGAAGAD